MARASDVNDIVSLGYGSWSVVHSIPTLGYYTRAPATDVRRKIPYRTDYRRPTRASASETRRKIPGDTGIGAEVL